MSDHDMSEIQHETIRDRPVPPSEMVHERDTERPPASYESQILEAIVKNNEELERMRTALLDPGGQLDLMAKNWGEKLEILKSSFTEQIGRLRDEITIDRTRAGADASHVPQPFTVLVVDDNEELCLVISNVLEHAGITAYQSHDPEDALSILQNEALPIDVALVDIRMPRNGKGLAATILHEHPRVALVLMSGTEGKAAAEALAMGAHSFLEKPFRSNEELVMQVRVAAEFRRLKLSSQRS